MPIEFPRRLTIVINLQSVTNYRISTMAGVLGCFIIINSAIKMQRLTDLWQNLVRYRDEDVPDPDAGDSQADHEQS